MLETQPDNQRRILFMRIAGSIAAFSLFVIVAVGWVLTQNPTAKWALFVPLVGAMLILPRDIRAESIDEEQRVRIRLWLSYERVAYFLLALFVMLGLPELRT